MNFSPRPTRAEIDLTALIHNLQQVRACCAAGQEVLAVVKADAYGHGAVAVSRALQQAGVSQFGVALLEEGLELRHAGIDQPILVLGGCYAGQEEEFVRQRLAAAVFSLADLQRLDAYGRAHGVCLPIHLKCDTGMGRVGFLPDEIPQLIESVLHSRGVTVDGLMSHLACADEIGSAATHAQNWRKSLRE